MKDLISRLLDMYPPPPAPMVEEMRQRASMIPADRVEDVYQAILEEAAASQKIGIKHLLDACKKLNISTRKHASAYVEILDWTCDCCGAEFSYHPAPTDEQRVYNGWHDACPICGFQVAWTRDYRAYEAQGRGGEWYQKYLDRYRRADMYGPDKARGLFFNKGARARELRDNDARKYPAKDLAEAKRFGSDRRPA